VAAAQAPGVQGARRRAAAAAAAGTTAAAMGRPAGRFRPGQFPKGNRSMWFLVCQGFPVHQGCRRAGACY